jgi:hypothetical protein
MKPKYASNKLSKNKTLVVLSVLNASIHLSINATAHSILSDHYAMINSIQIAARVAEIISFSKMSYLNYISKTI